MSEEKVKPGVTTSEFQQAKSAGTMALVGLILSAVVMYAPQFVEKLDGKVAAYAAAFLGVSSVALKLLTTLGYVKSRTMVKVKAEDKKP